MKQTNKQFGYLSKLLVVLFLLLAVSLRVTTGVVYADDIQGPNDPGGVSSIGDFVWHDLNANGQQDATEPGINGVLVELYIDDGDGVFEPGAGDTLVTTMLTGDNPATPGTEQGWYTFTNLTPGTNYWVNIPSSNFTGNAPLAGHIHTSESIYYPLAALSPIPLAGGVLTDRDFGFAKISINVEKTVYLGHDSGAKCDTVNALESVQGAAGAQVTYCFVVTNTGTDSYFNQITLNDPLLNITQANMTFKSGSQPLAPAAKLVYYYQTTLSVDIQPNTVTASGNPVDSGGNDLSGVPADNNPTDSDTASVDVIQPGIRLQKTVYLGHNSGASCPGSELVSGPNGAQVTYCFVVTNTGDTYLNNLTINDPSLNITLSNLTPNTGTPPLAPGASRTYYYQTTIRGDLLNTATASGTPTDVNGTPIPNATPPSNSDTASVDEVIPANLLIDKDTSTPNVIAGGQASYTIVLRNTGGLTVTGVTVSDTLPNGFVYNNGSSQENNATRTSVSNPVAGAGALNWGTWSIHPNGIVTISFTVNVGANVTPTTYDNTAVASAPNYPAIDDDGTTGQDPDTPLGQDPEPDEDVTVQVPPNLLIDKDTTTPNIVAGSQATYRIVVRNTGGQTALGVTVADTLPAGFTYASGSVVESSATRTSTANPAVGANTLNWGVWNISPNGAITINFTVDVAVTTAPGIYDNTALASATNHPTIDDDGPTGQDANTPPGQDPETDEDVQVAPPPVYDLSLIKVPSTGAVTPGQNVVFTIRVKNQGNLDSGNYSVADQLPAGATFVNASDGGVHNAGLVTWNLNGLAPGAIKDLTILVTVSPSALPGSLRNWAEITNDSGNDEDSTPDTNPNNDPVVDRSPGDIDTIDDGRPSDEDDSDIADVAVLSVYDLALAKVATVNSVAPGANITFTIRVKNQGNIDSGAYQVSDPIPSGATFVSASDGGSESSGVVIWNLSGLAPGASKDLTLVLNVSANTADGSYSNRAEISSDSSDDEDSTPDSDTANDPVTDRTSLGDLDTIDDGRPNDEDDSDNATFNVTTAAIYDLALVKVANAATVQAGQNVTFTIRVKNQGNVDSGAYSVIDQLPAGLTFVSASDGGANNAGVITWNLSGLAPGATRDLTVVAAIPANSAAVNLNNWAEIASDSGNDKDSTPDSNPGDPTVDRTNLSDVDIDNDPNDEDDGDGGQVTVTPLTYSLGNRVWYDSNNNGVIDNGETGVDGVSVRLLDSAGNPLPGATLQTTANGGYYRFDNLLGGEYIVEVVPPTGYRSSDVGEESNPNNNGDSNDNGVTVVNNNIRSNVVTLGPGAVEPTGESDAPTGQGAVDGQANMTVDFGFYRIDLGNRVWLDSNNNGVQDAGEPGIDGVTVELLQNGNVVNTITTSNGGYYTFTNVAPGTYQVRISNYPAGHVSSTDPSTATAPNTADGDDNGLGSNNGPITSAPFALTPGGAYPGGGPNNVTGITNNPAVDFGLAPVPYDRGDLPDLTAGLGQGDYDTLLANNGASHQIVAGLRMGAAIDAEADGQPNGMASGDDQAGTPDDEDGVTLPASFVPGQNARVRVNVTNTTGQVAIVYGFIDFNADGDFNDAGESVTGIATGSGTVNLDFNVPADVVSGIDFGARFRLSTQANLGPNGAALNGEVEDYIIRIPPTVVHSLGNLVWLDNNNNGRYDPNQGETGLANVPVTLYLDANDDGQPDGSPIATTNTDNSGRYLFNGLNPGNYIVEITAPAGYVSSGVDGGDPDSSATDNDDNGVGSNSNVIRSQTVTLSTGGEPTGENPNNDPNTPDANSNLTVDFGLVRMASIGDLIWEDRNNNGQQDAGESGLSGVTVTLQKPDGTTQTTTTNSQGFYSFTNLLPGVAYTISVTPPAGYQPTKQNVGNDASDSDINSNGQSQPVTLQPGEFNQTVDAGLWRPAALGDLVWDDRNNNGQQDDGEPGLPGVTVTLRNPDGSSNTTTTDANGNYTFTNLLSGVPYTLSFTTPTGYQPTKPNVGDDTNDSDINPATGQAQPVVLQPGESNSTVDAGYWRPVNLGNLVWYDKNNNGQYEPGLSENGIAGVTVQLFQAGQDPTSATPISTTTTNANGNYNFVGLAPGQYFVYIPKPPTQYPASSVPTDSNDNGEDNDDNGIQTAPGQPVRSPVITLALGSEPTNDGDGANGNLTVDFGFIPLASVGELVWNDTNGNGVQDPGEPGRPNVTVTLIRPDGSTQTTVTDSNGNYSFTNLLPGVAYTISFESIPGFLLTLPNAGNNDGKDSDPDPNTGLVTSIVLQPGDNNTTIDAGYVVAKIDLVLVKGRGTQRPISWNDVFTHTLTFTNAGNLTAPQVTITETVPVHTTYHRGSSTPGWSCVDGAPAQTICIFPVGNVAPGERRTIVFGMKLDEGTPGGIQIRNVAVISTTGEEARPGEGGGNVSEVSSPTDEDEEPESNLGKQILLPLVLR